MGPTSLLTKSPANKSRAKQAKEKTVVPLKRLPVKTVIPSEARDLLSDETTKLFRVHLQSNS